MIRHRAYEQHHHQDFCPYITCSHTTIKSTFHDPRTDCTRVFRTGRGATLHSHAIRRSVAPLRLRILARAITSTPISGRRTALPSPSRAGDIPPSLALGLHSRVKSCLFSSSPATLSIGNPPHRQSGISVSSEGATPCFTSSGQHCYAELWRSLGVRHHFLLHRPPPPPPLLSTRTCRRTKTQAARHPLRWEFEVRAPLQVHVSARADSRACALLY